MCGKRWRSRLLSILLLSALSHGLFAQVTISEKNYDQLVTNLIEARKLSQELATLRQERETLLSERQRLIDEKDQSLTEKESLLKEKNKLLDEKAKQIADLELSLTKASESLKQAETEAAKIERQNKILKASSWISWPLVILLILLAAR